MQTKKTNDTMSSKDYEKLGRDLWNIFELNYKNRKRLYTYTFLKGLVYGFGIFLGGTILVALLVYGLSLFDQVPFVDKVYDAITNPTSVQK